MSRTPSTMLELGTSAPDFSLQEPATGNQISLADYAGNPLLVIFSCNHCPFVLHILKQFSDYAKNYQSEGLSIVMINSNDVGNYEADSPEKMVELIGQYDFSFPYLYDETQQVAIAYQAACTPDLFLFDSQHKLVYRGQFDGSRPGNDIAVTGQDLTLATEALLNNQPVSTNQIPSLGCNIKWKQGNEPDYF
ncbi:MAG: thioredoxin family protein [Gammaproteobacteria bacterium]|jgi:peroxiredoxin|nr:thioredoxin family protein [Gammaproteobacteria bacterium]MBT3721870.1 thioredoxin family protein [Gammaproteobacteria bacterium]MBT4075533.1 thioredoxin family protein [Gammaproteobacteria bacterium]MBT4196925.1 thioredoxin family protein [Gammaproteobacteria bacterium]MBT4451359.1 thioredoxin family protein [Gammaproteobacteria bacterium]